MPKYVFSSSLTSAEWAGCTIVRGDVVQTVSELKQQPGRDLIMYGHGRLGQTLLRHQLIDELRFAVHPVVGHGKLLFREAESAPLELVAADPLDTGVVVLSYRPTP